MTDPKDDVSEVRKVLNVGGGSKGIEIPDYYNGWQHDLLDIDPRGNPDLCCDARELYQTAPRVYDALYCSHNLEHYYLHEVPGLLLGFKMVLKKDGFADIRVPDLGAVMKQVVAEGLDLQDVLYLSPAGPITVHDVLYGYGVEMERSGNPFYAHKSGFTEQSLGNVLIANGFPYVFTTAECREIRVLAFKREPTDYQKNLLKLV